MKSGFFYRLLPFGLILALLAGVVACSRTPREDVELMDSAEAVMESAPDTALALMKRVDSAAVRACATAHATRCSGRWRSTATTSS